MPTRDPRRLRAAALGSALAALTLAGHTAAGGGADPIGVALVLMVSVALGTAMSSRRPRPLAVLGVLLGGQALLHEVLTFTSAHAHGGSATALPGAVMALAHIVASIVATLLVLHTERIASAWAGFLAALLGERRTPALPVVGRQWVASPSSLSSAASDFVSGLLLRRGPPALSPAACAH